MSGFRERSAELTRNLKAKLRSGQIATLIAADHPSASLAEKLGEFGFDALLIDCEHGTVGPERVEEMARRAHIGGLVSIVRPETGLDWLLRRYLECGVSGWMIPLVHNAAMARDIVDAIRFACPFDCDNRFLIVMIESIEAVNDLDQILEVEGIDAFLVAPYDLSRSMGPLHSRPHWLEGTFTPVLRETMDRAIKAIVDADKTCGVCVTPGDAESYIEKGAHLLYTHADQMLAAGSELFFEAFRKTGSARAS
jgi:4-hydroxy-2-oxoheptanedioate aldolase